ncbi:MAG TPA: hypothetical protein VH370_27870 [Humisphaera sp.]|jgi:hypothetical protein|nr:hypothetical protein [Humisphaera sp.]
MAEKATPRKKPARQQMLEGLAESEKSVTERRETQAKPEEKLESRATVEAVAAADELAERGVVQAIGELKSNIGRMLSGLSDRLEEQVARYVQIQRAIAAKDKELKEIYEIQRSASTLTAMIELQDRQRDQQAREAEQEKVELQEAIEQTRLAWEQERKQRDAEAKERETAEQKRREREKEEYRYSQSREQQQARDQFADEMGNAKKEWADHQAQAEKELADRIQQIKAREEESGALRQRVEAFPKELEAAVAKAVKEVTARLQQESASREELAKREFAGERNVLTTRITSLEQIVKEQSERITGLLHQVEKGYGQVQEIAVRAIEGSASSKQLVNLQQMLADQARKGSER